MKLKDCLQKARLPNRVQKAIVREARAQMAAGVPEAEASYKAVERFHGIVREDLAAVQNRLKAANRADTPGQKANIERPTSNIERRMPAAEAAALDNLPPDNLTTPQFSKQRQHVPTTGRMTEVAPEVSAPMASSYEPLERAGLVARAEAEVAADLDAARANFETRTADAYSMALGHELALRLQDQGRHAEATAVRVKMAEMLTTPAQMLQFISAISKTSPEGVQQYATKVTRDAVRAGGKLTPEVKAMLEELDRLNRELEQARRRTGNSAVVSIEEALKALGLTPERLAELQVRLRDILVQGASNPKDARARLVALLTGTGGMSQARAEQTADAALREFTRRAKATRDQLLRDLVKANFPQRERRLPKTLFQKWERMNAEGLLQDETLYAGIAKQYGIPVFTRELSDRIAAQQRAYAAAPEGPVKLLEGARLMDMIYSQVPSSLWDKVATLFKLVKLMGLKTIGRNILGSGITQTAETLVDGTLGRVVDVPMRVFSNGTTAPGFYLGARWRGFKTPWNVARAGFEYGKAQGRLGWGDAMATLINASRFYSRGVFDAQAINSATRQHVFDSRLGRLFEDVMQLAIGTSDIAFFQSAVEASLERQKQAAISNGTWMGMHTAEMLENAQLAGQRATFTDETRTGKALGKLAEGLNWFTGSTKYGIGTVLLPYTRVPGSIVEKGVMTWSPLGVVRGFYKAATGASAQEIQDAFSRGIVGTATVAAGLWLARLGIITGGAEEDEDLRRIRQMQGFGAYAINLSELKRRMLSGNWTAPAVPPLDTDVIKPYAWAQPVAMPLAVGAHIGALEKQQKQKALQVMSKPDNLISIAFQGGLRSVLEQPMFMGLARFAEEADRDPAEALAGLVVGAVDFIPQFVGNIREATNNIRPETRSGNAFEAAIAQRLSRIPGVDMPPRFDLLGQPDERYHENVLLNALANPVLVQKFRTRPELAMLEHIMTATGRTDMLPRTVPVKMRIPLNGEERLTEVELTAQQVSDMQRMVGRLTADMLAEHAQNGFFTALKPAQQADIISAEMSSIFKAAQIELLNADPVRINMHIPVRRGVAGFLPVLPNDDGKVLSIGRDPYAENYVRLARERGYVPQ